MERKTIDHKLTVYNVTEVSHIIMDTDFYLLERRMKNISMQNGGYAAKHD